MNNQKIAVIGAGIIGLCTAFELQKKGMEVTLFDGQGIGQGASFGNAGHFATEQVFPLADPALLPKLPAMLFDPLGPFKLKLSYLPKALPWFCRFLSAMRASERLKNTAAIRALNDHAITRWQQLLRQINSEHLMTKKGSLLVYDNNANNTNEKQLNADYAHYRSQGIALEKLSAAQVLVKEPSLGNNVLGALYFTDVAHTSSPKLLCDSIFQAFTAFGGQFVNSNVDEIKSETNPITVTCEKQHYQFDKIVVCAGAHAKKLAAQLGHHVPLESERGYHLMLPVTHTLQRPVASSDRKFIMTPMQDGLRLAGTVEFAGNDNAPDYRRSDMLLTHAKALLPSLADINLEDLTQQARWMGLRPSLPDSLPIIDVSKHNKSVYFNFGHQHLGLTWGAISATLLTQLLRGMTSDVPLHAYRIDRF
ncbi:MAG: FAD-binding oxidoreductase [Psychrobium sp.]|nr:FAD-binding oxidoreductase [Psychrobium sp.]